MSVFRERSHPYRLATLSISSHNTGERMFHKGRAIDDRRHMVEKAISSMDVATLYDAEDYPGLKSSFH